MRIKKQMRPDGTFSPQTTKNVDQNDQQQVEQTEKYFLLRCNIVDYRTKVYELSFGKTGLKYLGELWYADFAKQMFKAGAPLKNPD